MTDTKRNQADQPNRGQQNQRDDESRRDDEMEPTRSEDRGRETSVAHDRGRGDSEHREFSSDREADELGSELEREAGIESEDEENIDRPGRSNR